MIFIVQDEFKDHLMTSKKFHASQRRDMILATLRHEGLVTVPMIAKLCKTSEMTIRRDFDFLDELGLLARTHGGAVLPNSPSAKRFDMIEPSLDRRIILNQKEKFSIAALAAQQVEPNQTIALDIGTTVFALADRIKEMPVRVFSTSLPIVSHLGRSQASVYMPGGKVQGTEPSVTGVRAIEDLKRFHFDTAFIGVSGLAEDGFYDYSIEETEVKSAIISQSKHNVVLMDSSKFGRVSVARVSCLSDIDQLITDQQPSDPLKEALELAGVQILIASNIVAKMRKGIANGL